MIKTKTWFSLGPFVTVKNGIRAVRFIKKTFKGAFGWVICHPEVLTSKILVPVLWDFEKRNLVTFWVYQCFMSKKIFGYFFWVFFII